ncbi:MAG TPA: YggT family protein [Candidatus Saccharimonadales bacterium]|nr:YggT family protein [Candidatus Saccharimonadales bacterium]
MVDRIEHIEEVETPTNMASTSAVHEVTTATPTLSTLVARVIWYVAGVLVALLIVRFMLALLGANPGNGFANFIYSVSHPFVAPFFGLFSYDQRLGVGRFEIYTLIAMVVYALVAWALARLVTIGQSDRGTHYTHHATRA